MKKLIVILGLGLFSLVLVSCGRDVGLRIANWGEFIDEDLVAEFERIHGINVEITNYTTNDEAIILMQNNWFDVVIPSEYVIEELVMGTSESLLQEIDWDFLEELGLIQDMFHKDLMHKIDTYSTTEEFNLLDYGVPYKWGQLGIVYNKDIAGLSEAIRGQSGESGLGWNIFTSDFASANNVSFYNSAMDGFAVALAATDSDVNSNDQAELDAAAAWLTQMRTTANPAILQDQLLDDVPAGVFDIALMYSGDAALALEYADEGVNLGFYVPENTNLFVNSMVIPTNSQNVQRAHEFIAFMSSPFNALRNSMWTHYTSTIQTVFDFLTNDRDGLFANNEAFIAVNDIEDGGQQRAGNVFFRYVEGRRINIANRWNTFLAS